jgi:hypothetical protein
VNGANDHIMTLPYGTTSVGGSVVPNAWLTDRGKSTRVGGEEERSS